MSRLQNSLKRILGRQIITAPSVLEIAPGPFRDVQSNALRQLIATTMTDRTDVIGLLPRDCIGIELGVASGGFADRLLAAHPGMHLFGVDIYAGDRAHDSAQYAHALATLLRHRPRSSLVRLRFDEAVAIFPDEYFDFVYIDGYAHTGQEGGDTLRDWWAKAKPGAIFGGDDYSPDWPLTVESVDAFAAEHDLPLFSISNEPNLDRGEYSNWFTIKPNADGSQIGLVADRLRARSA